MKFCAILTMTFLAGCGLAYHGEIPPGGQPGGMVQMRNSAGESRWCPSRQGQPGAAASVGASTAFMPGPGPAVGIAGELLMDALMPSIQTANHEACVNRQRELGFELVDQGSDAVRGQSPTQ